MSALQDLFLSNNQSFNLRTFNRGFQFQLDKNVALVTQGVVSSDILLPDGNTVTIWLAKEAEFLNFEALFDPSSVADRLYTVEANSASISLLKLDYLKNKMASDPRILMECNQVLFSYFENLMDSYMASATFKGAKERAIWAAERLEKASPEPIRMTRKRFGSHIFTNDLTVSKVIKSLQDEAQITPYMQKIFFQNEVKGYEVI